MKNDKVILLENLGSHGDVSTTKGGPCGGPPFGHVSWTYFLL